MRRAFLTRFITGGIASYQKLVARLERKWENRHPRSFRNYSLFKNGIHSTLVDLNDLRLVWSRIALDNRPVSQTLNTMTRRELFVFRQVPQDILRAAPLMLLAPLPGTFLLYPLFFAYPRLFLTRQFWTGEQRAQFDQDKLDRRMKILPDLILTDLHRHVTNLRADWNTSTLVLQHFYLFDSIYHQIKSGVRPSVEILTQLIPLFSGPLALEKLPRSYVIDLCKLHDLTIRLVPDRPSTVHVSKLLALIEPSRMHSRRLRRLRARSHLFIAEDRLLRRDFTELNGSFAIDKDECLATCVLRGIDPFRTDTKEVARQLRSWIACSLADSESNHSFRLHLPIFLFHRTCSG